MGPSRRGARLDIDILGTLCEELERLTELERRAPRPPRYPSALWSERNAAAERVAPLVPELAARLREWVADVYPTEVDDILIGLADALDATQEQLDEECEYSSELNHALDERDELRTELKNANQTIEEIEEQRDELRRDLADAWIQLAHLRQLLADRKA